MAAISPACGAPACTVFYDYIPVYETMLTVEDGSEVANANTYVDADDVAAYATLYGWTWSGTDAAKEQAILRAMIFIESFEPQLCGGRVTGSQALSWPREYVPDARGTAYLADNAIPSGVTNALNEAAILELATPGVLTQAIAAEDIAVRRKRDKVGPLETEVEYGNRNSVQRTHYTRILEFLRPYLCSGIGSKAPGRVLRA